MGLRKSKNKTESTELFPSVVRLYPTERIKIVWKSLTSLTKVVLTRK